MQNPNGQQFGLDTALLCSGGKRALISERQREHKPAVRLGDRQMQPGAFVSQRLRAISTEDGRSRVRFASRWSRCFCSASASCCASRSAQSCA